MKNFKILAILLFSSVISFYSCNDETKKQEQEATEPQPLELSTPPANSTNSTTTNQTTNEPAQNAGGVYHYTCSQGCAGGAASAGKCGTCGNTLAHNQAYHAQANTDTPIPFTTPTNNTPPAEPAQNTAGVYHYTCGKGCAGGAGSAGNCGTCGGALAHNAAYHQ